MLMINSAGGIVLVNSQVEKLFGYSRQELLTMTIEALMPQRFRKQHEHSRSGFLAHPDTRAMGAGRDPFGMRKGGSEIPIEIGLNLRSEEHTSELQSLMRISYAVFCLKKKQ